MKHLFGGASCLGIGLLVIILALAVLVAVTLAGLDYGKPGESTMRYLRFL